MMTSSAVIMPRSPGPASAAWTKKAGVPVEARVAAILRATWPDLPSPVTINRPLALRIVSAAAANAVRKSDRSAAASAAMPLPSASSVRRAEATAAFAGSVPDEFVINRFGVAMSASREMGASASAANPSLAWPHPRCDAGRRSQRVINHNCFKSVNEVFRAWGFARARNSVGKRMNLLEYLDRDDGSSQGPPRARNDLARAVGMPCADRARRWSGASPNADPGYAAPGARRLRLAAGFAAAQDRQQPRQRRPHRQRHRSSL